MRKSLLILIVFLTIGSIVLSVVFVNSNLSPDSSSAYSTNQNLKYFGYMGLDSVEYIQESYKLRSNNIGHFSAPVIIKTAQGNIYEVNKPDLTAKMQAFTNTYQKAIIGVQWVFFADLKAGGNGQGAVLASNWEKRWNDFLEGVKGYEDSIYAIYFDEPFYNGVSKDQLLKVLLKIRFDLPKTNLMVVEGYDVLEKALTSYAGILDYITDYGFDYYFTQYPQATFAKYMEYFNKMVAKLPQRMKIWLIPDGFAYNSGTVNSLVRNFDLYADLAKSNDRVVGMLTFIYKTTDSGLGMNIRDLFDVNNANYSKTLKDKHYYLGQIALTNHKIYKRICSGFSYSNWGSCVNKSQTRFLVSKSPYACEGGNPIITNVCN